MCELVAAHYNEIYNTDEFVAFGTKRECEETAEGYSITLRSQEFNSANVLVTMVYINTSTGEVTDDLGNTWMLDE